MNGLRTKEWPKFSAGAEVEFNVHVNGTTGASGVAVDEREPRTELAAKLNVGGVSVDSVGGMCNAVRQEQEGVGGSTS